MAGDEDIPAPQAVVGGFEEEVTVGHHDGTVLPTALEQAGRVDDL